MKHRPKSTKGKSNSNNKKVNDLAPFRENSAEEFLTTNQGLRINDDQNSLKAGALPAGRLPASRKDHAF